MLSSRSLKILLVALLGLLIPASAWAAPNPEAFIKARHVEITALLRKPRSPAVDKRLEAIFDQMLDYDSLAKQSLRDYWDQRTDAERKDFKDVLKRLVRNAYKKNLRKTLGYAITYGSENKADQGYVVHTVAKSRTDPREDPVHVDYLVHQVDGKWRIFDIVTEGSSLVNNYRSQFRRIIKKDGFPELMRRMKRKLDKEEKEG
jgi:phospholipid transport system substrate-binding protein